MLTFRNVNIAAIIILGGIVMYDISNTVHAGIYGGVVLAYIAILSAGSFVMSLQFYLKSHIRGPRSSRRIAITFDDGPLPGKTEQILSLLNGHHVKAAFFCIGKRVHDNPQLVKNLMEDGHLI